MILILIIIIIFYLYISNVYKYNINSKLQQSELKKITTNELYNPYLFDYSIDLNIHEIINTILDNYYIVDDKLLRIDDFFKHKCNIYKNKKLLTDLKLDNISNNIFKFFKDYISFNTLYTASIIKGKHITNLEKNTNNIMLIGCIYNNCEIYIFNPKHEVDIKNKELINIKKWGIKIKLEKNKLIYIPTNWLYIILIEEESILFHITSDTYFTFFINFIRQIIFLR